MKIIEVCPYDLGTPGGVQLQALGLSKALSELGHQVILIAPGTTVSPGGHFDVRTMGKVVSVPANGSMAPVSLNPASLARIAQLVWGFAPDIVHIHEPAAPLIGVGSWSVAELMRRISGRTRVVATFHRSGISRSYRGWARLTRLPRPSACVAVSKEAAKTASSAYGFAMDAVISNGIDLTEFNFRKPNPDQRSGFIFVGRLEERKGVSVLLEALRKLEEPADVKIVGDGPMRVRVEKHAEGDPRLSFAGRLDRGGLLAELNSRAVLIAPALGGESFGVVLLEGMAAGLAVVATDIDGYRDTVPPVARELMVPPGDAVALAEIMSLLFHNKELVALLGSAGEEWVKQYDFLLIATRYEELFASLI